MLGLSPRVRGSLLAIDEFLFPLGSIPACAGEPRSLTPRLGGNQGLSPRVRGSHSSHYLDTVPIGSIPACAGSPL